MADVALVRAMSARARFRADAAAYFEDMERRLDREVARALAVAFRPVLLTLGAKPPKPGRPASSLTAATPADYPIDPDDLHALRISWAAEVDGALLPFVAELFDTGALATLLSLAPALEARTADQIIDAIDDVLDRRASDYLDAAGNRLRGIGDTAWGSARQALADGFRAGDSIPDIAARVEHSLGVATNRATTIARTEVVSASNAGSIEGARVLGDFAPARKVWLATLDPRTREAHAEADGQEVGLDEAFTVDGESLDFPGDPSGSPENVINCRCTVIYTEPDESIDQTGRGQGGDPLADLAAAGDQEVTMPAPLALFRVPPRPVRQALADTPVVDAAPPAAPVAPPAVTPAPAPEVAPVEPGGDPTAPLLVAVPPGINVRPFSTIMAVEGRWTGDDRFLLPGSVRWDGMLPMPFTADHVDDVPSVVGLVGDVRRVPGPGPGENLIIGYGLYDLGPTDRPNEAAYQVADRVDSGALRGVSIRIDDVTVGGVDPTTVAEGDDEWWMDVVEDCRLRALSPTPVAAFAECAIFNDPTDVRLTAVDTPAVDNPAVALPAAEAAVARDAAEQAIIDAIEEVGGEAVTDIVIPASAGGLPVDFLVAAGGPLAPPASWFTDPGLTGPTPLTVTPDGQVFGHVALWGTCHTGFAGECITPPHSSPGYAMFRTGEMVCSDGSRVPVGRLTMGAGHASTRPGVSPAMAAAHYDNTTTTAAYLAAGEDRFGIWVNGAARSNLTDEEMVTLAASPPSGDWRNIGGRMEMLALLCVNAPGFPVPRARVASGRPQALVAAGQVTPRAIAAAARQADPSLLATRDRIAASVGRGRQARVAELVARAHGGGS